MFIQKMKMLRISLIFGEKGSGKTTFVKKLVEEIISNGKNVVGVYSEYGKRIPSGQAYFAVLVPTFEKHLLCHTEKINTLNLDDWRFDYPLFKYFYSYILANITKADVVVIDEIGLLETLGKGWHPTIDFILSNFQGELYLTGRNDRLEYYYEKFIENQFPHLLVVRTISFNKQYLKFRKYR